MKPKVARVLLVAHLSRQRELADWLCVDGEGVDYELHLAAVEAVPLDRSWDVVVLDGESLFDDRVRRKLMRRLREPPRGASILFVCSRLPHERELADAAAWADDFIYSGWMQPLRVRSRVQVVALAPWRRSEALRRAAERAGDTRLRVLPGGASEARPRRGSPKQTRLTSAAFDEGRRIAVAVMREQVNRVCAEALEQVALGRACPEAARNVEETYRGARSPVVAARFGGSSAAIEAVWGALRQLVSEELAAIERRS